MPRQSSPGLTSGAITDLCDRALHAYERGMDGPQPPRGWVTQLFLNEVLRPCLPPTIRIGSGEIEAPGGARSGPVDLVLSRSGLVFPTPVSDCSVFPLASVSAVVLVYPRVGPHWSEACRVATRVRALQGTDGPDLAVMVAGFEGWTRGATMRRKMETASHIDGVFSLTPPRYSGLSSAPGPDHFAAFLSRLIE